MLKKILVAASVTSIVAATMLTAKLGFQKIYTSLLILNSTMPNPDVQPDIEENWQEIHQKVTDTTCLEITFNPSVSYSMPKGADEFEDLLIQFLFRGLYGPVENRIYLNTPYLKTDDLTWRNLLGIIAKNDDAQAIFAHEQTHSWLEEIAESEDVKLGILLTEDIPLEQKRGIKYVSEGISEYVEMKYKGKTIKYVDSWAHEGYDLNFSQIGLKLVGPIIDRYGEEGIRYLVANLPKEDDMADLAAYQNRVLDALSKYAPVSECNPGK